MEAAAQAASEITWLPFFLKTKLALGLAPDRCGEGLEGTGLSRSLDDGCWIKSNCAPGIRRLTLVSVPSRLSLSSCCYAAAHPVCRCGRSCLFRPGAGQSRASLSRASPSSLPCFHRGPEEPHDPSVQCPAVRTLCTPYLMALASFQRQQASTVVQPCAIRSPVRIL